MDDLELRAPATTAGADREQRLRESALKQIRAKLPGRFHREPRELLARVQWPAGSAGFPHDWLQPDAVPALVIAGAAGSGKTSLAAALYLELARVEVERPTAVFDYAVNGFAYMSAHELALDRNSSPMGREPPLVALAHRAYVLVLDDLGTEPVHVDTVATILRRGDSGILRTIVATTLTPDEIGQRYGSGVARRLLADGYGTYVALEGARA